MRSCLLMALLVTTQLPAHGNEGKPGENGGKQKEAVREENVIKGKPRIFHAELKFSMEQRNKDGDVVVEGKTYPGSTIQQTKTNLDLLDGKLVPFGGTMGDKNTSLEIKITSLGDGTIRLMVSAKQSRTESLEAGESRSWNLNLEATKTVKLGEKIKLEFGDEKTLGTKCMFEGVIEEK